MADNQHKTPYIWVNEFTEAAVKSFYEDFFELEADPTITLIPIFIDSYGGSVDGLFAMRDLIKNSEKPVATICVGKAMSAGAGLLASGHKGLRFMAKDAEVMIHELSTGFWGKNQDIQSTAKWTEKLNKRLLKNLAEDMDQPIKLLEAELHKQKNADWYLSSREAKKWGVVDYIEIPRIMYREPQSVLVTLQRKKGT